MFIGFLQDISDIVLIYTSGPVTWRQSGWPNWSQVALSAPSARLCQLGVGG